MLSRQAAFGFTAGVVVGGVLGTGCYVVWSSSHKLQAGVLAAVRIRVGGNWDVL